MKFLYPLPGAAFGCCVAWKKDAKRFIEWCESHPDALLNQFYSAHGLMVIHGLEDIARTPELLVRLSRLFGPEVENYRQTLTNENFFHDTAAEILVLSNNEKVGFAPPPQPEPPTTADGSLPIQYPHRKGWHTDQSYRRPPPDVSLLYGVACPPSDQGQTLYADSTAAYAALDEATKTRVDKLEGCHALTRTGRSLEAVRRGEPLKPLLPHQASQRHPIVRKHPVTGERSLYLCEDAQMDWVIGPIAGLEPGPDGEGGQLVHRLMHHMTQPRFVYVHAWLTGDLVIADNRNLVHTPTWFDAEKHVRELWRTTVMGNPGQTYAGESKSWVPAGDVAPMAGLEGLFGPHQTK